MWLFTSSADYSKREMCCYHGGLLTTKISELPIFYDRKMRKILAIKLNLDFTKTLSIWIGITKRE